MSTNVVAGPREEAGVHTPAQFGLVGSIVLGAAAAAHLPLLVKLAQRMWATEHYQFFPLILVGAAYLTYARLKEWRGEVRGGAIWLRCVLFMAAIVVLAAGVLIDSPVLAGISMLTTLLAFIYAVGGRPLLGLLFPVWLFLWLAIPIPLGFDLRLIIGLQNIATFWASHLLDLMGYRHLVDGVVLHLPGQSFEVEEACSGIHSLFAALGCTAFYVIFSERKTVRAILIVASVFLWVLIANAFRVVMVVLLSREWNLPVVDGVGHEIVGTIVFALVVGLVASFDRLLLFFLPAGASWRDVWKDLTTRRDGRRMTLFGWGRRRRRSSEPAAYAEKSRGRRGERKRRKARRPAFQSIGLETISLVLVFALLAGVQFSTAGVIESGGFGTPEMEPLYGEGSGLLPENLSGWEQQDYEQIKRKETDINGALSRQWRYAKGDTALAISIDGPFLGWHNLGNCFEGQGWEITEWVDTPYQELGESIGGGCTELHVQNGVSLHGIVVYGVFDADNRPFEPPSGGRMMRQLVRRFPVVAKYAKQMAGETMYPVARPDSRSYQVQVFCQGVDPFTDAELEQIRELFHVVRHRVTSAAAE